MHKENPFESFKKDSRISQSSNNQVFTEREIDLNGSESKGTIREIKFDSIHIMRISLRISQETSIPFMANEHKVVLFFSLLGDSELNTNFVKNLSITTGTHNIFYTAPTMGKINCGCGRYEVFYIGMSPELFREYFPREEEVFERFNDKMNQSDFTVLRKEQGLLNHRMIHVIEDICYFESQQFIKKIFLKAKVIELLSLQLNELCMICNPVPVVRPEDAEKMYEVKRFITEHLGENHSLTELAHLVGTNDYTLKKEFKELFGTTVFGFWADAKMENAQKLLSETGKDIKEISEITGYKNPQHFSTAFKRKFGITPSHFRKNIKN